MGEVHDSVYDTALGPHLDSHNLQAIKDASLWSDVNVMAYDPRDHFDFAYVDRGWARVEQRLGKADIVAFAYAAHAICDFYSHSLWAHPKVNPGAKLPLYDPQRDLSALEWDFSQWGERPECTHTLEQAQARWKGKLISGQWWRWFTSYPDELQTQKELEPRRCLPDHDALAVDSDHPHGGHRLFPDAAEYGEQFRRRKDAATRHVELAFLEWYGAHGDAGLWKP